MGQKKSDGLCSGVNLASPGITRAVLRRHGIWPRKRLGQNFLIDSTVLEKVVGGARLSPEDLVLEVGAGIGTLTKRLAQTGARVVAVEIDERLAPALEELTRAYRNVEVIFGDVLELDLRGLLQERSAGCRGMRKVVGNLPYCIATPLVLRLVSGEPGIELAVVMVQREVAERMTASPGTKAYGTLSVAVQYRTIAETVCAVSRAAFFPQPEVEGAVLRLAMLSAPVVDVPDEGLFFAIVRAAFRQRRKMVRNALASAGLAGLAKGEVADVLERAGVDGRRRGETLSVEEFAAVAREAADAGRGRC